MNRWFFISFFIVMITQVSDQQYEVKDDEIFWSNQRVLFSQIVSYDHDYRKFDKKHQYYLWKMKSVDKELALYEQFEKVHARPHKNKQVMVTSKNVFMRKSSLYDQLKKAIDKKRLACLDCMHYSFAIDRDFVLDWYDDTPYDFAQEERVSLFNQSYDAIIAREQKVKRIFDQLR